MNQVFRYSVLGFILFFLFSNPVFAATFSAEFTDVEGKVFVVQKVTGNKVSAKIGMKVWPLDVIETWADSDAEILYEDGNVTVLDEDTTLTIVELSIDENRNTTSILDLAIGRVKNSVTKLVNVRSTFEVHTKSAVAGVTGTPPWVVKAFRGPKGTIIVEVDLLGKRGEKGQIFVKGKDPGATVVTLTVGMRTVTKFGQPPVKPIVITPARLRALIKALPIKTPEKKRGEKRKEMQKKIKEIVEKVKEIIKPEKIEEIKKELEAVKKEEKIDIETMIDHLSRAISVGEIVKPEESTTGEETEKQTGSVDLPTAEEHVTPPPTTRANVNVVLPTRVKVRVDIK